MPRLPQPGGDKGNWGDILNDFLGQSHNGDGTLKDSAVLSTGVEPAGLSADTKGEMESAVVAQIIAQRQARRQFAITDFGAKVDGVVLTDGAITVGGNVLTSQSYSFVTADIGKRVAVIGAGPIASNKNDGVLLGTIMGVAAGAAVLSANASRTVSAVAVTFGTNDDAAIAAAQTAAVAAGGGEVFFPAGNTIAQAELRVQNGVSFAGINRFTSHVYLLKDGSDWLSAAGASSSNPVESVDVHDFSIHAQSFISSTGYVSALKVLNLYYMRNSMIFRMAIYDAPATAIPWDHGQAINVIAFNYITNPGRLAPSGVGPGGSGIGMGTLNNGDYNETIVIGNVIEGVQSGTVAAPGVNGIFLEGQTGSAPASGTRGYRIIGNFVFGMPFGIADDGSYGTVIEGNVIVQCGIGIALNGGTVVSGFPGKDTIIQGNTIIRGNGPAATDGVGIHIDQSKDTSRANITGTVRALISGNQITANKSAGIKFTLGTLVDLSGITIIGNGIRDNGGSGIVIVNTGTRTLLNTLIEANQITGNGTHATPGDNSGITLTGSISGLLVLGNSVSGNNGASLSSTATIQGSAIQDNLGLDGGGPIVVTVGASPFTYTAGPFPTELYISGGVVTGITKNNVSLGTPSRVRLNPAQTCVITYSAAPAVTADLL